MTKRIYIFDKNLLMRLKFRWIFLVFVLSYGYAQPQSFELDPSNGKDSINIIDFRGLKQGRWIIFGKTKKVNASNNKSIEFAILKAKVK